MLANIFDSYDHFWAKYSMSDEISKNNYFLLESFIPPLPDEWFQYVLIYSDTQFLPKQSSTTHGWTYRHKLCLLQINNTGIKSMHYFMP